MYAYRSFLFSMGRQLHLYQSIQLKTMNKDLLIKYISGEATEPEKADIATWLDSSPENMREYLALRKLRDMMIWQQPEIKQSENKYQALTSTNWLHSLFIEALKVAAILLIAFLGVRYLFPEKPEVAPVVMQTLHVPAGQRAEITLADGTNVWLNANTTLTFPTQFSDEKRQVNMEGEGFFEVVANKSRPFIVKTSKYDVKVWGTKFNLLAYSNKSIFETSLLEGSVEILKSGGIKGVLLKPEERIFQQADQLVVGPIVHYNHFLWKDGIISFNDESFPELVSKLELYFDLKIEVKNDKILKYRCTGKFRTKDGVEHILKVLQLSNKFSFTIDDKLNLITIK